MDVGLAASAGREPAISLEGRPDHYGWLAVDGDFWCVNLQAADQQGKLQVHLEGVSNPVREPFRRAARRQDRLTEEAEQWAESGLRRRDSSTRAPCPARESIKDE